MKEIDRDIIVLKDPLDNELHLPLKFQQCLQPEECVDKDISLVIVKPAIIILPNKGESYMYHVRLVGWDISVLMKSESTNGSWLVCECIWNVDSDLMKDLMFNRRFVTF